MKNMMSFQLKKKWEMNLNKTCDIKYMKKILKKYDIQR